MSTAARLEWRTSTYSSNGQSCVEVAPGRRAVLVRDTKDRGLGRVLLLDHPAWNALRTAALVGHDTGMITRGTRLTRHAGVDVHTDWHVSVAGRTLHFTDAEWAAFAAGVRAGEFALEFAAR